MPQNNFDLLNTTAREKLHAYAQTGLFKIVIPQQLGGLQQNFSTLAQALFQLGQKTFDPSLLLSLNAHLWGGVYPLFKFAGLDQQREWLHGVLNGTTVIGHAITEPQAGSDLTHLVTEATSVPGGYILNGHKRFITNASIADALLVYAKTTQGLSCFYVKKADEGAKFISKNNLYSFKTSPIGDVLLQDCFVGNERMIGVEGSGKNLLQSTLEHERAFLFAGIAGILDKQLQLLLKYVRKRKIGSSFLSNCQTISHRLAIMRTRIDTVKLWFEHCARLRDQNKRITLESSQLKIIASEAFLDSSSDAIQIMGACSLEHDGEFAHLLLDAAACRLLSGSNEIQKNIIATLIGAS